MRSKHGVRRAEADISVVRIQLGLLGAGSIGYLAAASYLDSLGVPLGGTAVAMGTVAAAISPRYFRLRRETGMATELDKAFVTFTDIRQSMQAQIRNGFSLLGWGFAWQKTQCQAAKDIMASDWYEDVHRRQTKQQQVQWRRKNWLELVAHPWRSYLKLKGFSNCIAHESGYTFLRALAPESCKIRPFPHGCSKFPHNGLKQRGRWHRKMRILASWQPERGANLCTEQTYPQL